MLASEAQGSDAEAQVTGQCDPARENPGELELELDPLIPSQAAQQLQQQQQQQQIARCTVTA